jgi:hypothetical protein
MTMKRAGLFPLVMIAVAVMLTAGCATYQNGYYRYDPVASSALGLGALGTALGFAATGDPMWAAVGGISGLATGAVIGDSIARSQAAGPPPPAYGPAPPPPSASQGYYRYKRCKTVHTVVRENGKIIDEYDKEVCDDY